MLMLFSIHLYDSKQTIKIKRNFRVFIFSGYLSMEWKCKQ